MTSLSTHEELILLRKRARRRLVGAVTLVVTSTAVLWTVVGRIPNRPMKPESVQITASNMASSPAAKPVVAPAQASVSGVAASKPAAAQSHAQAASQATALVASLEQNEPPAVTQTPEPKAVPVPKPKVTPPAAQLVEPAKPKPASKPASVEVDEPVVEAKLKPHPKPVEKPHAKVVEKTAEPKAIPEYKPAPEPKRKKPDPAAILEGRFDAEEAPVSHKKDKPEPQADAEHKTNFVVQLAAMSDPAKADAMKAKLSANGISARFSKVETSKGEVTRVRMGPFTSREEADAAVRRLAKAGVAGFVVSK